MGTARDEGSEGAAQVEAVAASGRGEAAHNLASGMGAWRLRFKVGGLLYTVRYRVAVTIQGWGQEAVLISSLGTCELLHDRIRCESSVL